MKPIALYYLAVLDDLRAAARGLGYALGLHGSLQRDLDLIAVPWTEDARPAAELVEALRKVIGGYIGVRKVEDDGMTMKPHGRMAYSIHFPYQADCEMSMHAYIDLSVMPCKSAPAKPAE